MDDILQNMLEKDFVEDYVVKDLGLTEKKFKDPRKKMKLRQQQASHILFSNVCQRRNIYRPKRSLGQGNVFTGVCLSTGKGSAFRGVCIGGVG